MPAGTATHTAAGTCCTRACARVHTTTGARTYGRMCANAGTRVHTYGRFEQAMAKAGYVHCAMEPTARIPSLWANSGLALFSKVLLYPARLPAAACSSVTAVPSRGALTHRCAD